MIPRQDDYVHYDGMEVVKMEGTDKYYFKVDIRAQEGDGAMLYAPNLILTLSIMSIMALINRR